MTPSDSSFLIQDGQTVVLIGDSITDCGRRDASFPFGSGYVKMVIDLITARYPDRKIRYINEGIGGDVSIGLRGRWHDDVLVHNPDWLSVMIGINDIHRTFSPNEADRVPVEMYRDAYDHCLARTAEETDARIILMDPFYISQESDQISLRAQVLELIPQYIAVVREMAEKYNALHVPLHDIFQEQLKYRPADTFCPEPVHPFPGGHLIMAHAWLQAMGW